MNYKLMHWFLICLSACIALTLFDYRAPVYGQETTAPLRMDIKTEPQPAKVEREPSATIKNLRLKRQTEPSSIQHLLGGVVSIDKYYFENTAQVVAPQTNTICPNGRVIVSTGEADRVALLRDLDANGRVDALSTTGSSFFPLNAENTFIPGVGTDNILVKLKGGSLLAVRLGLSWELPNPNPELVAPWWNDVTIQNYPKGARVVAFVWRSTNCGNTWTRQSAIDPIIFEAGRFAWPRPGEVRCADQSAQGWARSDFDKRVDDLANAGYQLASTNAFVLPDGSERFNAIWSKTNSGCFGGWDRIEAYADPWNGNVYVSMNATGGPTVDYRTWRELEPSAQTSLIFESSNGGRTWKQIQKLDNASTPIVMTSTPNGRLYAYTVIGAQPTLFYSLLNARPAVRFSQPIAVNYKQDGIPLPAGADSIYGELVFKYTNSISRISTDATTSKVRLSYQWMDGNGKTAIAVLNVEIPNDAVTPIVTPITTFQAADSSTSTLASSFIEDPNSTMAIRLNTSVLYWIEGSTDPAKNAFARYSILRGETGYTSPDNLGGPWSPTGSAGHYMYGGSFSSPDGTLNFLTQWAEPGGIRANIVIVPPDLVVSFPASNIAGQWNSNIGLTYEITQNANKFSWTVTNPGINQKGEGTIENRNVRASWSDANGSGSAKGVIKTDETGKAMRIEWDNKVTFTR